MTMTDGTHFEDFDDKNVYDRSRQHALNPTTRNFVVEFGKDKARISFNLGVQDVEGLIKSPVEAETPVRWM